jgi:hypothetical protein
MIGQPRKFVQAKAPKFAAEQQYAVSLHEKKEFEQWQQSEAVERAKSDAKKVVPSLTQSPEQLNELKRLQDKENGTTFLKNLDRRKPLKTRSASTRKRTFKNRRNQRATLYFWDRCVDCYQVKLFNTGRSSSSISPSLALRGAVWRHRCPRRPRRNDKLFFDSEGKRDIQVERFHVERVKSPEIVQQKVETMQSRTGIMAQPFNDLTPADLHTLAVQGMRELLDEGLGEEFGDKELLDEAAPLVFVRPNKKAFAFRGEADAHKEGGFMKSVMNFFRMEKKVKAPKKLPVPVAKHEQQQPKSQHKKNQEQPPNKKAFRGEADAHKKGGFLKAMKNLFKMEKKAKAFD